METDEPEKWIGSGANVFSGRVSHEHGAASHWINRAQA